MIKLGDRVTFIYDPGNGYAAAGIGRVIDMTVEPTSRQLFILTEQSQWSSHAVERLVQLPADRVSLAAHQSDHTEPRD